MQQLIYISVIAAAVFVAAAGIRPTSKQEATIVTSSQGKFISHEQEVARRDHEASAAAFLEVYKVLMSPRCMNCHPKGDSPLQGDDNHQHTMDVQRGPDGKGLYAMKCASCHQPKNVPGPNMPPGNPNWHLPAADMPMVFEGKTPRQLALQLKDPAQNGHKTMQQLIDHVAKDSLVLWGWNPGEGRTLPPLKHAEFVKQFKAWVAQGAAVPSE